MGCAGSRETKERYSTGARSQQEAGEAAHEAGEASGNQQPGAHEPVATPGPIDRRKKRQHTKSEKANIQRAERMVKEVLADFDRLFDVGFQRLGKRQSDLQRSVQQLVFLKAANRLNSGLRILLERKTREYISMRAKKLVRPEPLDFVKLWNDYVLKRRLADDKAAASWRTDESTPDAGERSALKRRKDEEFMPKLDLLVLMSAGYGDVFRRVLPFLDFMDLGRITRVSIAMSACLRTHLQWRAFNDFATIGSIYQRWHKNQVTSLQENVIYLDNQITRREKENKVDFIAVGQRAFKVAIETEYQLGEAERQWIRMEIFGPGMKAMLLRKRLDRKRHFKNILSDHFSRFAKHLL